MPGGPGRHEGHVPGTVRQCVDHLEGGAGRQQGGVPRSWRGHGVGVDGASTRLAEVVQRPEVRDGVDERQLRLGGPTRLEGDDGVAQPGFVDARQRGLDAGGAFGVSGPDVVVVERRGGRHEEHRLTLRLLRVRRFG